MGTCPLPNSRLQMITFNRLHVVLFIRNLGLNRRSAQILGSIIVSKKGPWEKKVTGRRPSAKTISERCGTLRIRTETGKWRRV